MDFSGSSSWKRDGAERTRHLGLDPSGWLFVALVPVTFIVVDPSQVPTAAYALLLAVGSIAVWRRRSKQREGGSNV